MEQYCSGDHARLQMIPDMSRFGICMDNGEKEGCFHFMIAGTCTGKEVPEDMYVVTIPELPWAKFTCVGPFPGALQAVNTKIFSEWLPKNKEYDIAADMNIKWYTLNEDSNALDDKSEVWIPVKRKV